MSFNVLIASHFHINLRYQLFKETVKSLANQTLKPLKIMISYSKEDEVFTNVEELFKDYFGKEANYFINYSEQQLTQFEHLEILVNSGEINGEYITFCDDDDMYHPKRLEIINDFIINNPGFVVFTDFMKIIDIETTYSDILSVKKYNGNHNDFGNMIIKSKCFIGWFTSPNYLNYKLNPERPIHFDDLIFRISFKPFTKEIDEQLYLRRSAPFTKNYRYWNTDIGNKN